MKDGNVNEVNNNTIYNNPASSAGTVKMVAQKNDFGTNAINIFFTDDASTGGLGQTLGYYDFNQDWIVIRKSAAQDEARDHFVLLHEMGHFFSLPHTFLGWDQEPWDGTTVTSVSPGGELNELADGSNCETAGDMICDTPADYNLGFGWDRCNAYDGGCKDLNGELLNPQEENMMGYFLECNEYVFSDDQKAIMDSDYQTSRRSYLRVSYMPTDAEVSGIVELNSPADDATTTFFNGVELSWTPVENASHYWLELTQGIKKTMYIADQSKIFLTDLAADKTYRWRVIPFNEISTCAPSSATWSFRTGEMTTSTSDSDNLEEELIVSPNPIVNNELNIELTNSYLGKFSLNLHDLNGNKVDSKSLIKSSSQFSTKLENLKLENGFYILRLDFGETTIIKKVIVHE